MDGPDLNDRIVELESRLAFQDDTIEKLNEVIVEQQKQLDRLENDVAGLGRKLGEILQLVEGDGSGKLP